MHHEVVPQLCSPRINDLAGRPSYGLLKEVDGTGNLSVETTGNGCPAVRSDPIRHATEMYAVTGRGAQIAGESRFANPTTTWLEARIVLRIRKLKIKPLDAWDVWICKQCKQKGRNPYTTKLTLTRIGLRPSSQRYGSQEGSHPCTRPRVAAKTDDRVLQQRCHPIDPDLLLRLEHDYEVRICHWAQARIGYPAEKVPFFPFPCFIASLN